MRETETVIPTESVVDDAALDWFRELGYDVIGGPDMPPGSESCGPITVKWCWSPSY